MLISKRKFENTRITPDENKITVKRVKINHDKNNNCSYSYYNVDNTIQVLSNSIDKLSICLTPNKENVNVSYVDVKTEAKTSDDGVFQLTIRFGSMHVD